MSGLPAGSARPAPRGNGVDSSPAIAASGPVPFRAYGRHQLDRIPQIGHLSASQRLDLEAVSAVLPFRVNGYVLNHLIDWHDLPDDAMFQLTFPQAGMLPAADLATMRDLVVRGAGRQEIERAADAIRRRLKPHPGGQMELNVPLLDGVPLEGVQHKYPETVLFFPASGQTCHSYCTYCFRWAQFVGPKELRFASPQTDDLVRYLRAHEAVSDVLVTGGDPMVMSTEVLRRYVEPLLEIETVTSIRFGTKSLAWWPYRFLGDRDADALMSLFDEIVARGKNVALMAHFSHPRELEPELAQAALRRVHTTGAVVRAQAPLVRRVNDDPALWADLWRRLVRLGGVPYYMFVERDTGPHDYFKVPLSRALDIFEQATADVSGLARTARGPTMSATPGKVQIVGRTRVGDEDAFVLKMVQSRRTDWLHRTFFARYDPEASWLDELRPLGGGGFFFSQDPELAQVSGTRSLQLV